jgi:hypothetical protein
MRLENYPYFDINCKGSTVIGAQWIEESSIYLVMDKT